jgi:hypothetical protein
VLEPDAAAVLARILAETQSGRLKWERDDDDWFKAEVGTNVQPILIRRLYIEATNQTGADPYFVELSMAGWNTRFAITGDSDGWRAIREILDAGLGGWNPSDPKHALATLELRLRQEE